MNIFDVWGIIKYLLVLLSGLPLFAGKKPAKKRIKIKAGNLGSNKYPKGGLFFRFGTYPFQEIVLVS